MAREPRFQLKEGESQTLHFKRTGEPHPLKALEVLNISDGGAAFLVAPLSVPVAGEIIQVEVQILEVQPTLKRMARVLRVERVEGGEHAMKLAVQFVFEDSVSESATVRTYLFPIICALGIALVGIFLYSLGVFG
jgi:hypothetical protein